MIYYLRVRLLNSLGSIFPNIVGPVVAICFVGKDWAYCSILGSSSQPDLMNSTYWVKAPINLKYEKDFVFVIRLIASFFPWREYVTSVIHIPALVYVRK